MVRWWYAVRFITFNFFIHVIIDVCTVSLHYYDKHHTMLKEQPFRLRISYDFLSYVKCHLDFPITDNTCLLPF